MSDDLDALLAQADNADIGLCDDLAAAVRTLRTDYDTALDVIERLLPFPLREWNLKPEMRAELWQQFLAGGFMWADAERAVLVAAETRHQRSHP